MRTFPEKLVDKNNENSKNKQITIGYVTSHMWGEVSFSYYQGVVKAAKELGVNLITINGNRINDLNEFKKQANIVYNLISKKMFDGLIFLGSLLSEHTTTDELDSFYKKFDNFPVVGIAAPIENRSIIIVDDIKAINDIMEHLIEFHNYKKIAFVRGPENYLYSEKRFDTYKNVLEKHNIKFNPDLVTPPNSFTSESGEKSIKIFIDERHLKFGKDIEAIITPSDLIALGILNELNKRNIKVPEDVALTGFNNRYESKSSNPPLTTIEPLFINLGKKAVETIISIINGDQNNPKEILMPTKIILRQSCGCPESSPLSINLNNNESICLDKIFENKETISAIMKNQINYARNIFKDNWANDLIQSFIKDLNDNTNDKFINSLISLIDQIKKPDEDVIVWQSVITEMKNHILPYIYDTKYCTKALDIWDKARIKLNQAVEYSISNLKIRNNDMLSAIHYTDQNLMTTFEIPKLLDIIENILPQISAPGFYISLYNKAENPLESARLIFAYENNKRISIDPEGYNFDPKEIIPIKFRPKNKSFCMILYPLYFMDTQIGFAVFEEGVTDKAIYHIISGQLSGAFYRSMIFQKLKASEEERSFLLKKLELENIELEKKVEERTFDIKKVNLKLQNAIKAANNANNAKSRFLANTSHEIRTPLNCIMGFAEILKTSEDQEQRNHYLKLIIEESEKLMKLINQILDISKIEAGKLKLDIEKIDFNKFMESINTTYKELSNKKGLDYNFIMEPDIPQFISVDSVRLRQILINLIGNAVKFTEKGSITVSVEIFDSFEKEIILLFKIKDTGIGIPKNRLHSIFETFVQAENNTTRKYGGTGLGTSISKQLVMLMGGEIGVDSHENEGSTFWFTASLKKPLEMIEKKNDPIKNIINNDSLYKNLKYKTVLLVEDYPTNRELALYHLKNLGCKIEVAENGKIAIDKFLEFNPDLILMDIQMPEMDGCQATKIIRKEKNGNKVSIIGMTANTMETDIINYRNSGIDDILTKPFKKDSFIEIVVKWLNNPRSDNEYTGITNKKTDLNNEIIIDINKNLESLGGNKDFFIFLVTDFLKNIKNQIKLLKKAYEENDYLIFEKESHKIKGVSLVLMAYPLSKVAVELESMGIKKDFSNAGEELKKLEKTINELNDYLQENLF
jgi:signal transduction histidine kinase/DNA-binding LacI/PurR family transcriptional regulator/DNA-binding NarL/FixJ family response regulator/HPt (histidine-containing phosphotransfer) domain-containing protein